MNNNGHITLYGISNCDSVKKAMVWLKKNYVEFDFHDFNKEGLNMEKIKQWVAV